MNDEWETIAPADAFRFLLRAEYPHDKTLPDEITDYWWFASRRHRSWERTDEDDEIVKAYAKKAIKKLYAKVREGSIRLTGILDPKKPSALIQESEQSHGDLNVFKRELELPTRTYTRVSCVKADVIGGTPEPSKKGRPLEYDWDQGFQYMHKLLEERGDPLSPLNAIDGWRSDADVGRAVVDYIATDDRVPDFKNAMKHVRPELKKWALLNFEWVKRRVG
jgi:hypothetical protein